MKFSFITGIPAHILRLQRLFFNLCLCHSDRQWLRMMRGNFIGVVTWIGCFTCWKYTLQRTSACQVKLSKSTSSLWSWKCQRRFDVAFELFGDWERRISSRFKTPESPREKWTWILCAFDGHLYVFRCWKVMIDFNDGHHESIGVFNLIGSEVSVLCCISPETFWPEMSFWRQ